VPLAQVVAPVQPDPPHCPYNGAVAPVLGAVVVGAAVVGWVGVAEVTRVVAAGWDVTGALSPLQLKTAGPGMV